MSGTSTVKRARQGRGEGDQARVVAARARGAGDQHQRRLGRLARAVEIARVGATLNPVGDRLARRRGRDLFEPARPRAGRDVLQHPPRLDRAPGRASGKRKQSQQRQKAKPKAWS
jgi:hypothetical protein